MRRFARPHRTGVDDAILGSISGTLLRQRLDPEARGKVRGEALPALHAMSSDRDVDEFMSRQSKRLQFGEPCISHIKRSLRRFVIYWCLALWGEECGALASHWGWACWPSVQVRLHRLEVPAFDLVDRSEKVGREDHQAAQGSPVSREHP